MTSINRRSVFVALVVLLLGGAAVIDDDGPQASRATYGQMGKVVFAPFLMGVSESIGFGPLGMATLVTRQIGNRKFNEYVPSLHLSFRKHFRAGCLMGFPVISRTESGDGSAAFCYGHEL